MRWLSLLTGKHAMVALGFVLAGLLYAAHIVVVKRAEHRATVAERARWVERENQELVAKNRLIAELQQKYRALEQKSVNDLAALSAVFQRDLDNVKADRDRFVAGVRSGAIRLRIPAAAREGSSGNPAPSAGSGTSERHAAQGSELPPKVAEDLYLLAAEADEVVLQLQAAQAIIRADREVCR